MEVKTAVDKQLFLFSSSTSACIYLSSHRPDSVVHKRPVRPMWRDILKDLYVQCGDILLPWHKAFIVSQQTTHSSGRWATSAVVGEMKAVAMVAPLILAMVTSRGAFVRVEARASVVVEAPVKVLLRAAKAPPLHPGPHSGVRTLEQEAGFSSFGRRG